MQELLIGDPAPGIRLAEFVKGAPLPNLELGKVYVLEFWATWCGPCQANVPHLSDLQDKYPQATFIGVAVMEPDTEAVRTFVAEMGDQIRYRIAIEEPLAGRSGREGGSMTKHWLEASYQRGIPAAFIVNPAGLIAWIGHPIDLDEPLAAIINGSWDLDGKAQAHRQMLTVESRKAKISFAARDQKGPRGGQGRQYCRGHRQSDRRGSHSRKGVWSPKTRCTDERSRIQIQRLGLCSVSDRRRYATKMPKRCCCSASCCSSPMELHCKAMAWHRTRTSPALPCKQWIESKPYSARTRRRHQ